MKGFDRQVTSCLSTANVCIFTSNQSPECVYGLSFLVFGSDSRICLTILKISHIRCIICSSFNFGFKHREPREGTEIAENFLCGALCLLRVFCVKKQILDCITTHHKKDVYISVVTNPAVRTINKKPKTINCNKVRDKMFLPPVR